MCNVIRQDGLEKQSLSEVSLPLNQMANYQAIKGGFPAAAENPSQMGDASLADGDAPAVSAKPGELV